MNEVDPRVLADSIYQRKDCEIAHCSFLATEAVPIQKSTWVILKVERADPTIHLCGAHYSLATMLLAMSLDVILPEAKPNG